MLTYLDQRGRKFSIAELLALIEEWTDPMPQPVIERYGKLWVVRDDLLKGGSKERLTDALISQCRQREIVFGGCPATGYAQQCLPLVTKKYGKEAVLFMAARLMNNLHEYQKRALAYGAKINWVPHGMLNVTLARAREYAAAKPTERLNLPLGLEHPTVVASVIKIARTLEVEPSEIWSVGGSGTLNRGLQMAFPTLDVHVIEVGHKLDARQRGRAIWHKSPYSFTQPVRAEDAPPFPSAPTYDAKAWPILCEKAKENALFWNVGA